MPVDVSDGYGRTALHRATMSNRTDVIKYLLHKEADVNRQTRFKETSLHIAARYNYTEVAQILIDNGADVNLINDDNRTPVDEADTGSEVERLLQQVQQSAL